MMKIIHYIIIFKTWCFQGDEYRVYCILECETPLYSGRTASIFKAGRLPTPHPVPFQKILYINYICLPLIKSISTGRFYDRICRPHWILICPVWNFERWIVSEEFVEVDLALNKRTYIWGFHRGVVRDSCLIWDVTLCHWGCSSRLSKEIVEMRARNFFQVRELKPSDTARNAKKSESFSLTNFDADPYASILTKITNQTIEQPTN